MARTAKLSISSTNPSTAHRRAADDLNPNYGGMPRAISRSGRMVWRLENLRLQKERLDQTGMKQFKCRPL